MTSHFYYLLSKKIFSFAPCKVIHGQTWVMDSTTVDSDSRCWIPDSSSVELAFRIPKPPASGFRKQNYAEFRIRITLVTWDIFLFYLVHNNFHRTLQGSRTQSCFPCTVTHISRHFYMENFHKDSVWKVMNVSDVILHKQLKTGFIN